MYKYLLILRYLRKRRIAWWSLAAVTLCTTMVLVVFSVMGGWLRQYREVYRGMSGDIAIRSDGWTGFEHYEKVLGRLREDPDVQAATPVIQTFALFRIGRGSPRGIQVWGLRDDVREVNRWAESLHLRKDRRSGLFDLRDDIAYRDYVPPGLAEFADRWDGMIVGVGVVGLRRGLKQEPRRPEVLYRLPVRLTLLPINPGGSIVDVKDKVEASFWVVDDSHTQAGIYDANVVYVAFDKLQKMLDMEGRTSQVQVRLRSGADLYAARDRIEKMVSAVFLEEGFGLEDGIPRVQTWMEANAEFIGAVERERLMVTILFGIISVVAIVLIFCIFYMIVKEKTRDIGILKSVGASDAGVAGVFVGYGAALGIVGAAAGLLLGWLIVRNINELHDWVARTFNVEIYRAETYIFDSIPSRMDPTEAAVIVTIAVVASVAGSLIPAWMAARMQPVESLRSE